MPPAKDVEKRFLTQLSANLVSLPFDLKVLYEASVEPNLERAALEVATNLASPVESQIAPATDLTLGGRALAAPPTFAVSARRDLWLYVVLAVVLLLCVEWITYHRRITV